MNDTNNKKAYYGSLSVVELRDLLRKRQAHTGGKKAKLVERLSNISFGFPLFFI